MKNKIVNNKCKICGNIQHCKGFCYFHYVEVKKLKILDADIDDIKVALSDISKLNKKRNSSPKLNKCKICSAPAKKDLCIIHGKISMYLNKNRNSDPKLNKNGNNNPKLNKKGTGNPKLNKCKICGSPAKKDLCIIHEKISMYLNKK